MILSVFIFIVIILFAFKSREKTAIVLSICSPIFNSLALYKGFSIGVANSILLLFFFHNDIVSVIRNKSFRLFTLSVLLFAIPIISSLYISSFNHIPMAVAEICSFSVYPLCLYMILDKSKYRDLFYKYLLTICTIIVIYTLLEQVLGNYYVSTMENLGIFRGEYIGGSERFGFHRVQAFFAYHETESCFCWATAFFLLWSYNFYKGIYFTKYKFWLLFIGLSMCLFMTGSRSGYISFVIALMAWVFFQKRNVFILPFLLVAFVYIFSDQISTVIGSILDSNSNSESFGSSQGMREGQLEASLYYWSLAPNKFLGNGYFFTDDTLIGDVAALQGAESLWFRIIIDQGIFGVATMIIILLLSVLFAYRIDKRLIFFPLAFVVAKTVAVVPATDVTYIYVFLILLFYEHRSHIEKYES